MPEISNHGARSEGTLLIYLSAAANRLTDLSCSPCMGFAEGQSAQAGAWNVVEERCSDSRKSQSALAGDRIEHGLVISLCRCVQRAWSYAFCGWRR